MPPKDANNSKKFALQTILLANKAVFQWMPRTVQQASFEGIAGSHLVQAPTQNRPTSESRTNLNDFSFSNSQLFPVLALAFSPTEITDPQVTGEKNPNPKHLVQKANCQQNTYRVHNLSKANITKIICGVSLLTDEPFQKGKACFHNLYSL